MKGELSRRLRNSLFWYLRQLLPLRYETTYQIKDQRWLYVWRMWFGHTFAKREFRLAE